jgi:mRNA interferase MazF
MTKRGEVYDVDWSPGRGSEQESVRPALIIQNDVGNELSSTTIVAAISTVRRRAYPFQVAVPAQEAGLPHDSIIKCEQVQTVDQARLGRLVGVVSESKMREVDLALHRSLGLRDQDGLT